MSETVTVAVNAAIGLLIGVLFCLLLAVARELRRLLGQQRQAGSVTVEGRTAGFTPAAGQQGVYQEASTGSEGAGNVLDVDRPVRDPWLRLKPGDPDPIGAGWAYLTGTTYRCCATTGPGGFMCTRPGGHEDGYDGMRVPTTGPGGFMCTRPGGHEDGYDGARVHVAGDGVVVLAVWPVADPDQGGPAERAGTASGDGTVGCDGVEGHIHTADGCGAEWVRRNPDRGQP